MYARILVVLPHPDDEAFGMSGTIAKYISQGAHVTYACLTLGEMGRNMGNPPFANRVTLPQVRKQELLESCMALGIQDLRMLGYHDKTIEFENQDELDAKIRQLIDEVKPELVLTFYPGYAVHPDHNATGAAVVRTISRMPKEDRPEVHCAAFAHNRFQALGEPDVHVDIRDHLLQKLASIRAHRSQFQAVEMFGGKEPTLEQLQERFHTESFYRFRFNDEAAAEA